jgi:hypothetical protein
VPEENQKIMSSIVTPQLAMPEQSTLELLAACGFVEGGTSVGSSIMFGRVMTRRYFGIDISGKMFTHNDRDGKFEVRWPDSYPSSIKLGRGNLNDSALRDLLLKLSAKVELAGAQQRDVGKALWLCVLGNDGPIKFYDITDTTRFMLHFSKLNDGMLQELICHRIPLNELLAYNPSLPISYFLELHNSQKVGIFNV